MESIYTELALYGSIIECARTDNFFPPISGVCDGTVSLIIFFSLCGEWAFVNELCYEVQALTGAN